MTAPYRLLYDVATSLKNEAERRLVSTSGGAVERSCVVPGAIAWDACQCGQLSVSVIQAWPALQFPGDAQTGSANAGACQAPYLVADLLVQVARCAPNPDASGIVACTALETAARKVIEDAAAVREACFCGLQFLKDRDDDFIVRGQVTIGPEGGCMGVEQRVTVGILIGCQANC